MVQDEQIRRALRFSAAGIEFVVAFCVPLLAGRWADGRYGTHPWLTLVGLVVGLAAAIYGLVRTGLRYQAQQDPPPDPPGPPD